MQMFKAGVRVRDRARLRIMVRVSFVLLSGYFTSMSALNVFAHLRLQLYLLMYLPVHAVTHTLSL